MKALLFLGLFLLVAEATPNPKNKVYERCELARILKKHGFEGFQGRKVADWICLVVHESSFNTAAIHDNGKSRDYGIFQINSKYWCHDAKTHESMDKCHIPCKKFLDNDIRDDMKCAKMIAQQARGLTPWVGWVRHCQIKNIDRYVKGCFKSETEGNDWL